MKNNRKFLLFVLTLSLMMLAACGSTSASNAEEHEKEDSQGTANVTEGAGEVEDQESSEVKSKDEYLNLLNAMEEADKNEVAETTTIGMIEQEEARFKKWDEALNEIYEVLKQQLSTEEMDRLRMEQRDWIEHRDKAAKEASLKYEGGSMEPLEYVATQASLTRDRSYELVAKYMK
ncbi:DUF1311 domain-containing protein [Sporosarcina sp. Sa2YVA2]|uniref:DUF1311 domain-containing protein n=1 Tax=Sporosarcina quadrami TaxID=2762234 RepID=A0ABR8U7J4_9BACL|nr:lysozyme inhibitor LprI family protein [Sporosarcina quadrami]MBD7983997.1 DUF1311 domain-containing protein [Sporosarcina quadrami]